MRQDGYLSCFLTPDYRWVARARAVASKFCSVLEMGSCCVAQDGFELLDSATGMGETIGCHYTTTPGLKQFHCRRVKQMVVYPHNGILPGRVKG